MPAEVAEVGPFKRRISVTIPADEVRKAWDDMWRQAAGSVQLKGFRPGKVPRAVLEKKVGSYVRQEVKQHLVNHAYRDALQTHNIKPVASPELDLDQIEIDPAKPLQFAVEVEVTPTFQLGGYKGLAVGAPPVQVTDADIDREVERVRGARARIESLDEGVATKGDYLLAEVSYRVDGAIVLHRDEAVIDTNRDVVDSVPVEGGTAAFHGKGKGATVRVPCRLPAEFEPKGFAGAEAELLCTVKDIKRVVLPELDDEFAKGVGASDLADLRARIGQEYQAHVQRQRDRYVEERLLDEVIKNTPFELPPDLLERATHEAVHRLEHDMVESGVEAAQAKADAASHTARIRQDQARALRVNFLVDRIAEAEKVTVTEDELEQAIRALAAAHRADVQQVYDQLVESGRLYALRAQLLEAKVRKLLRESAHVSDASVAPET